MIGRSPSGTVYELVNQKVAERYEPRDLPGLAERRTIPLQSIVVVQIRTSYADARGAGPVLEQRLLVIGSYPEQGETAYYGQLLGAPDGLVLAVKPQGNQKPGLNFRSDHVLRIEQTPPSDADDNVIQMDPIYEVRSVRAVSALDDAIALFYDNKLVGYIEAEHAPKLMSILKPTHPENIHESDSDSHHA